MYTQLMWICPHTHSVLIEKGRVAPWHWLWRKHTYGNQRYTPKKHTLNPGRKTPKSEGVLVSKQPRVHECSQPHHQSLSNYSHAPSLWHKSALISARCRIREYQIQHLLHLQTQPLKAQQSGSAGINKGRRGIGRSKAGAGGAQRKTENDRQAERGTRVGVPGCLICLKHLGSFTL